MPPAEAVIANVRCEELAQLQQACTTDPAPIAASFVQVWQCLPVEAAKNESVLVERGFEICYGSGVPDSVRVLPELGD